MPTENVYVQNARRLAQIGLTLNQLKKEQELQEVTAEEAEKLLKIPRERIAQVLTPNSEVEDCHRRPNAAPHYDIMLIADVLKNQHSYDVDDSYYVIADYQLGLLQADETPTKEAIHRYDYGWACNIFRNPHYMPKFRTKEIAAEILKKSVLRRIAWEPAEELKEGFLYSLCATYGNIEKPTMATQGLVIATDVPACPEEMEVEEYRQELLDMLLMDPNLLDAALRPFTIFSDEVLYSHSQEFENRLDEIYNEDEIQQDWLELLKDCPFVSEDEIINHIRGKYQEYRIVRVLKPHALISFLFLFGSFREVKSDLIVKYDSHAWKRIPNLYGMPKEQWEMFCKKGLKNTIYFGEIKLIPFRKFKNIAAMYGFNVHFSDTRERSTGFYADGQGMTMAQLIKFRSQLQNFGIGIHDGQLYQIGQFDATPVKFDKIFGGIMKKQVCTRN